LIISGHLHPELKHSAARRAVESLFEVTTSLSALGTPQEANLAFIFFAAAARAFSRSR
jgi:hypothetical protein